MNVFIFFLPEYSPFLNPIEEVFSLVKHFIKKLFYNSEITFLDAIVLGFNQLSKNYKIYSPNIYK